MRQLSKHDVNKLSVARLREVAPFEVMADGEVSLVVYDVNRVNDKPEASHDVNRENPWGKLETKPCDVNKLIELPLSKQRQATSRW